jgi:hypothetical protein
MVVAFFLLVMKVSNSSSQKYIVNHPSINVKPPIVPLAPKKLILEKRNVKKK